jgi:hypothetical protein
MEKELSMIVSVALVDTILDSFKGTSSSRPKQRLTSVSVAKLSSNSWDIGKLDMPTWGCCPNIR